MPSLIGDNTGWAGAKLKNRNSFSKPNFESGTSASVPTVSNLFNLGRHLVRA
jgi:hypothetical protein